MGENDSIVSFESWAAISESFLSIFSRIGKGMEIKIAGGKNWENLLAHSRIEPCYYWKFGESNVWKGMN